MVKKEEKQTERCRLWFKKGLSSEDTNRKYNTQESERKKSNQCSSNQVFQHSREYHHHNHCLEGESLIFSSVKVDC